MPYVLAQSGDLVQHHAANNTPLEGAVLVVPEIHAGRVSQEEKEGAKIPIVFGGQRDRLGG